MESKEEILDPKEVISFNISLGNYLDIKGGKENSTNELMALVKKKKKDKNLSNMEKIIFQIIMSINPKTGNFLKLCNRLLIFSILKYLNTIKGKKQISPYEIYKLIFGCLSQTAPLEYLLENENRIKGKEEFYLELIIPFIFDNQISQIINAINRYLPEKTSEFIKGLFERLDLKFDKSFSFIKDIIFEIINDPKNITIQDIENVENNYYNGQKNNLLRCKKCYDFPELLIDERKNITIKYKCHHIEQNHINNPKNIIDYKIKCSYCDKKLCDFYKNYLCSNCKSILCNKCTKNHFNTCLSLFFIPLYQVGFKCSEHNNDYEVFCNICNLNMCCICKKEHHHFSEYKSKNVNLEDLKNIEKKINEEYKIDETILQFIRIISSNEQYNRNLHFQYFFDRILLGKDNIDKCGLFSKFGGKEFNNYYSTLIQEIEKGSQYYFNIYNNIKNIYEKNKKIINPLEFDFFTLFLKTINIPDIYPKYSLLNNFMTNLRNVKNEINLQKLFIDNDTMRIKQEKLEIALNSLKNINNKYKEQAINLLNRSISDNIIRFLAKNYSDNFQKIILNQKIFTDINNIYQDDKIIKKIKLNQENAQRIKSITNIATINNEEGDTTDSEEPKNSLIFDKAITIKKKEISVNELNDILYYLLFKKDYGNSSAHPNNSNNSIQITISDDSSLKSDTNSDNNNFAFKFLNSLQNMKFIEDIDFNCLSDCLFDGKYEKIISKIKTLNTEDFYDINRDIKYLNKKVIKEFSNLNKLLDSLKSMKTLLDEYSNQRIDKNSKFIDFYERILKTFKNEEIFSNLLLRILNFKYKNSLLADRQKFISDCYDYILINLRKMFPNIIKELEREIKAVKIERSEKKNLVEIFEKMNQKLAIFNKNYISKRKELALKDFMNFLNTQKVNEEKRDYEEVTNIIHSIRNNLAKLIGNNKIDLTKYHKDKITTFLYLKQNKYK